MRIYQSFFKVTFKISFGPPCFSLSLGWHSTDMEYWEKAQFLTGCCLRVQQSSGQQNHISKYPNVGHAGEEADSPPALSLRFLRLVK